MELAGILISMNVVCTGHKSWWCVFVFVPHWASCTTYEDWLWKNSTKTHRHIWSSSGSSFKLCCSRAVLDEAITPSVFVSVTVSLLLTHKLCLSLSVTHRHTHSHNSYEGDHEGECVWYVSHQSDEIIVMLIESTSDATSHGSRPSKGQHTTHIPPCSSYFSVAPLKRLVLNMIFDFWAGMISRSSDHFELFL